MQYHQPIHAESLKGTSGVVHCCLLYLVTSFDQGVDKAPWFNRIFLDLLQMDVTVCMRGIFMITVREKKWSSNKNTTTNTTTKILGDGRGVGGGGWKEKKEGTARASLSSVMQKKMRLVTAGRWLVVGKGLWANIDILQTHTPNRVALKTIRNFYLLCLKLS